MLTFTIKSIKQVIYTTHYIQINYTNGILSYTNGNHLKVVFLCARQNTFK